jgi:signal transduction histidine kinase
MPFRGEFHSAFYPALRAGSSGPIEIYDEAVDGPRAAAAVPADAFRNYLAAKYSGVKIDAVIAVHEEATAFARQNRDVFGYAPIVALIPADSVGADEEGITGLQTPSAIGSTVELAMQVQPATRCVYVVAGLAARADDVEADVRRQIARLDRPLELVYLRDLPMPDLLDRVRAIPDRSIVLFVGQTISDRTGTLDPRESLAAVAGASPAPIFVTSSGLIGPGAVGGYVWQVKQDAGRLADLAIRVAGGARPRDLPPGTATLAPTFDWRQLQRWRIPESRLPADSVVLFRTPSFFEFSRSHVLGGIAVILAQLALIVGLLVQRVRRRRAEEELGQAEVRNSATLKAIPDLMFVILRDGTYVDCHTRDPKLLYAPPDAFLGRKVRDILPPALAETMMEAIERACQSEDEVVVEYGLPMGEPRFYEARIVRAGADRILSIVRDVTEAKRAAALNRDLARRLIASQEMERQRIARELHDDVSQNVAVVKIEIDRIANQVETAALRSSLRTVSAQVGEIASGVRNLSYELHPPKLQIMGLVGALESLCGDASKHRGLHVAFTHSSVPSRIHANVSLCLYRIVQEALHNVARHSQAREAQVHVACHADDIALRIADDGIGFDPKNIRSAGLGLLSMQERVADLGGQLTIDTRRGGGTRIDVRVPLAPGPSDVEQVPIR